jgi:hypothetical protein
VSPPVAPACRKVLMPPYTPVTVLINPAKINTLKMVISLFRELMPNICLYYIP